MRSKANAWEFREKAELESTRRKELFIPRLDVVSRDNYLGEQNFKATLSLSTDIIRQVKCAPADLGVMLVPDSLMCPALNKGDVVFIDTSQHEARLDENDIYLVRGDKCKLMLCRVIHDALGYYLWFDREGRVRGGKNISEIQWQDFFIAGRLVYRTGFL